MLTSLSTNPENRSRTEVNMLDVRTLIQINTQAEGRWVIEWNNVRKPVLLCDHNGGVCYNDSVIGGPSMIHFYRDVGPGRKERVTIRTAGQTPSNNLVPENKIEMSRNATRAYYDNWDLQRVAPFDCSIVDPNLVKLYQNGE